MKTTKTKTKLRTVSSNSNVETIDVHALKPRLLLEVSDLLTDVRDQRGDFTIRERIATLSMLHRIVYAWLRGEEQESENVGSAVRKYAAAFSAPPDADFGAAQRARRDNAPGRPRDFGQFSDDDEGADY